MDDAAFPRQYARTRRFTLGAPGSFTVSPDGARVLFTRSVSGADPRALLWLYQDGREHLLADPPAPGVSAYTTDRDARTAAYLADGEVWTVRTDGGAPRRVPTAAAAGDARLSPDGTMIAYVTAGGALHVVNTDGTGERLLAQPENDETAYGATGHTALGAGHGLHWAPHGRTLLAVRVEMTGVQRRYLHDPTHPERAPRTIPYTAAGTATPRMSAVLIGLDATRVPVDLPRRVPDAEQPPGAWHAPGFEYLATAAWPDTAHGGPVLTLHSRDQRTAWVVRADPQTGAAEVIARHRDETWVHLTPGTPLFTAAGTPVLPHTDADTRTLRIGATSGPPGVQVEAVLGAAGERVLFTASEDPTETHVWSHEPDAGFTRLTRQPGVHSAALGGQTLVLDSRTEQGHTVTVLRAGLPAGSIAVLTEQPLVTSRPVFLTLGPRQLNARLHLPSWHRDGQRLPVLMCPYSGPTIRVVTRARAWHDAVCQWFAEQGFAVLAADGAGTPGRGARFEREVFGDRLGPVLDDQVGALHAAAERYPALDLDRVGIRGWSYGGYLAAGAVLRRPEVFHAAVAGAPPTDRRLYEAYWEERWLGHPDVQPRNYERCSLVALADRLTRPLMLVQGLLDDNVFPAHTLRLSAALLAAGRPHTLLPLPGTGHRNDRPGTGDALLLAERDFLRRELHAAP